MDGNLLVAHRDDPSVRGGLVTHQWRHSICGCFDNCGICIIAYCIPCVSFGQTAEVRGKGCCCWGCLYMIPCVNLCAAISQRGDLRTIRGIPGSCFGDCLCNIFCPWCILVQERQESEHIQNDLLQILGSRTHQEPAVQVVVRQVGPVYMPHNVGYTPPNTGYNQQHTALPPQASRYEVTQPAEPAPPYTETTEYTKQ